MKIWNEILLIDKLRKEHKVPRLSNTREYIEAMLVLNNSAHPEE